MQFKEIKNEGLDRHFKVTIPAKDIDAKVNKELASIAKTARLDGFRVGKAPAATIQKKYGPSVRADIVSHDVRHAISDIIKKNNLDIAGSPAIEDLKSEAGKDVEFVLQLELMPEITMPDFKKIKITKPVLDIAEKDIEKQLERIAEMQSSFAEVKKAKAVDGDMVVIDFVGSIDGVEFAGGAGKGHELVLGSKSFIPGFEEQLIGAKAGDEIIVKVPFPESYHAKDLAGKNSEFKVTVHMVKRPGKTEINDDLAKKIGFKDLAELKERVVSSIQDSTAENIHTVMKMKLFDQLENSLTFEAPKNMFEREYNSLKAQSDKFAEADETMKDKSPEELDKYYRRVAMRRVKVGLMLSAYVKNNKLKIETDDIKAAILREARNFPGQENAVIEYYSTNKQAVESLTGPVLEEKAVKAIFASEVSMTEKKYSVDALQKFLDEEADADVI
jgi:trigger factor